MAEIYHDDLTVVYYSANLLTPHFHHNTLQKLKEVIGETRCISVTHKPVDLGENVVVNMPQHHLSIYKQILLGADAARTKYVAMAEDDALYSPEHFKIRPKRAKFAYNVANWGLYTWGSPVYSWKGRRTMWALIADREALLEALTERLSLDNDAEHPERILWAEPGKYERQFGLKIWDTEEHWTHPANIVFSHHEALGFKNLGTRKRLGVLRATEIPYWGRADELIKLYKEQ